MGAGKEGRGRMILGGIIVFQGERTKGRSVVANRV